MDIAIVTATFPPYFGGTGNVAYHNARCLAELGHAVTVYTAAKTGSMRTAGERLRGVTIRRFRPLMAIGNAPLLPQLALVERHDLIHLHYPFIFGAEIVLLLRRLRDYPYVLTYHNDLLSPGLKGKLFSAYDRVWATMVLAGAARVFVPSLDAVAGSRTLTSFRARHPTRMQELPNGVDVELFSPDIDGSAIRQSIALDEGRFVLLFVGMMDSAHHPKGGVTVLLDALARLADPGIRLVLAGGGDWAPKYAEMAANLGLARQVRFIGQIPHADLGPYYAAADVVVQPSQLFEPFGMVAVEAMASGRPVITSDLPGTRRVVGDAGGGVLVPPGDPVALADAIRAIDSDASLRQRLSSAGLEAVRRTYDWNRIAPVLATAYEEVLGARTEPG
jgi:glycosyltransferase involved in cell wall biosynthesis